MEIVGKGASDEKPTIFTERSFQQGRELFVSNGKGEKRVQTENMRNEQQQTINIKEIFRESNLKSECNFQKSKMPGAQEARAKASGEHGKNCAWKYERTDISDHCSV